jgi:tRNA(fMet)-specific endonuclease VapC
LTALDTNVLICYLKGDPLIVSRITATNPSEIVVPTIVVYELEYGTLNSRLSASRRKQLDSVLRNLKHVPFDTNAALSAAQIRLELEKRGSIIGPLDILIAGTALSLGATLVTNNTAEFSRVPGLRLADWQS